MRIVYSLVKFYDLFGKDGDDGGGGGSGGIGR